MLPDWYCGMYQVISDELQKGNYVSLTLTRMLKYNVHWLKDPCCVWGLLMTAMCSDANCTTVCPPESNSSWAESPFSFLNFYILASSPHLLSLRPGPSHPKCERRRWRSDAKREESNLQAFKGKIRKIFLKKKKKRKEKNRNMILFNHHFWSIVV